MRSVLFIYNMWYVLLTQFVEESTNLQKTNKQTTTKIVTICLFIALFISNVHHGMPGLTGKIL